MNETVTVRRTVKIKLKLDENDRGTLRETVRQYLWAANHIVDVAWPNRFDSPRTVDREKLHEQTYTQVRENTELHSSHVQLARDRVIEALQSIKQLRENGTDAGRPTFDSYFLDFNSNCATIGSTSATLATVDSRATVDFVIPESPNTPHQQYLYNGAFDISRSTLVSDCNTLYLHVGLKKTREIEHDFEYPGILGVDLGISNLAVTSTGRFWSGGEITHLREEYQDQRQSLQKCGTRWAHDHIQSISRKLRSQVKERLNIVANEIIEEAKTNDCLLIAFEDLSYIFDLVEKWRNIRRWAYRTLIETVEYKAKAHGITVRQVDPANTSIRCSTCGHIDAENRRCQSDFECVNCGYENHADYNAAKNIGLKQLRHSQNGSDGGAPVGVRVNSGIITDSGYKQIP
jgi:IS605 OrfB family transposase